MDGDIYHGRCLGFCGDTCFHIQSGTIPDWMCPTCSREVFPCYDNIPDLSHVKCVCCGCRLSRGESGLTQNFNPFNLDFGGNFNTFSGGMCDALDCASAVLQTCSYSEPTSSGSVDDSLSEFYFNNIDGFEANFNESLIDIRSLNCIPSLISFCETGLGGDDVRDFNMIDYSAEHLYAVPGKGRGSGLSVCGHKTGLFRRVSSLAVRNEFFGCVGGSLEAGCGELIFVAVCRFRGNESGFLEHFVEIMLPYRDKPLLVLGDFGLGLFECDNSANIDDFVGGMVSGSLFPLVGRAADFFGGSSALVGHAWTDVLGDSTGCDVVDVLAGSHKPLLSSIPARLKHFIDGAASNDTDVKLRNIDADSLSKFSGDFDGFLSARGYRCSEPVGDDAVLGSAFSDFYSALARLYSGHVVVDGVFESNGSGCDGPWIATGLAKACKVESKLHNRWIESRGTVSGSAAGTNYKSCRSRLKKLIQQAELNYFKNRFSDASGGVGEAWSVVGSMRCEGKDNKLPSFVDANGIVVASRRGMCAGFSDCFVDVARSLDVDGYGDLGAPDFNQYLHNSVSNSLFHSPIAGNGTYGVIDSLGSGRSDDVSPRLLEALCDSFCPVLVCLFGSCVLSGTFPDELGIAGVVPLFGSGGRGLMSDCGPISVLPTLSGILGGLIHVGIYRFLDENQVLYSCQFGFGGAHSAVHAIQAAVHSVTGALDASCQCVGIFVDFSGAFDAIQRSILLDRLYHYGVRGVACELISGCLSNREQFVCCGGECCSAVEGIGVGVPQGSVLGPLFFVLCVDDIVSCAGSSVGFMLFADDANIFICAPTSEELCREANGVLRQLKSYIDAGCLRINLRKCRYVHFGSNRQNTGSNTVSYDNFKFEQVQGVEFLGVAMGEALIWSEHVGSMTRGLSGIAGSLYKIGRCIPEAVLLSVCYALVNSQLLYGISIWGSGGSVSGLCFLFSARKRCIRSLFRVKRISILCPGHTKSTFTAYGILTVHDLCFCSVLTSVFSSLCGCPPQPIVDQVEPHLSGRREACLNLPLVGLSNHHGNVPCVGLELWNGFIGVTSALDILDASRLLYWKLSKFKKFVKDTIVHFQSLGSDVTWDSFNFNLLELEAGVLTGDLNPGSIWF